MSLPSTCLPIHCGGLLFFGRVPPKPPPALSSGRAFRSNLCPPARADRPKDFRFSPSREERESFRLTIHVSDFYNVPDSGTRRLRPCLAEMKRSTLRNHPGIVRNLLFPFNCVFLNKKQSDPGKYPKYVDFPFFPLLVL